VRRASQIELPLGLESYRNTALFSDHFLCERLPEMGWYNRDGRVGRAQEAHSTIKEIFADSNPEETLLDAPEAQCEEDIIRPVLRVLGRSGSEPRLMADACFSSIAGVSDARLGRSLTPRPGPEWRFVPDLATRLLCGELNAIGRVARNHLAQIG
jgi:hypothetical protein